jgi:hypothetical protein
LENNQLKTKTQISQSLLALQFKLASFSDILNKFCCSTSLLSRSELKRSVV